MFFSISKDNKDNFPHHYNFGSFIVNTDDGWKFATIDSINYLYKGYTDTGSIEDNLPQIIAEKFPTFLGNFCVIGNGRIVSDLYRSFPITFNDSEITNLQSVGQHVWCDNYLTFDNQLNVNIAFNDVIGEIASDTITEETAINEIDSILSQKIINFLKNNTKPLKIFLSGGVDSMLVYSYIKKYSSNYKLIFSEHFDYDYFTLKNGYALKKNYWAYRQLNYWKDECVLSSGAPGDELMLRSPVTANLYLRHHNTSIPKLLTDNNKNKMQFNYFLLEKNKKIYVQQQEEDIKFASNAEMMRYLCNINANDFQHWHLGNTLTYTPLRDLEIFKVLMRLDIDSAINQIIDSSISKKLIERNDPSLIACLSDSKNHENYMSNLVHLLD